MQVLLTTRIEIQIPYQLRRSPASMVQNGRAVYDKPLIFIQCTLEREGKETLHVGMAEAPCLSC